jgi:hypothetical protein
MTLRFEFLILIFLVIPLEGNASGTAVGNGGDPLFYYLESTRGSMSQTLDYLKNEPGDSNRICDALPTLTLNQRKDCADFARQSFAQMLKLNSPLEPIEFVLRNDPLLVDGPDGQPMPVAARTTLSNRGPIEFHRASIEFLRPSQMLMLMVHEFGHKVKFKGHHVQDNLPIMSFRNGRELLDSFGKVVSHWAVKKGFIGDSFALRDLFDCKVNSNAGQFRVRVSTSRKIEAQNSEKYEITMGYYPSDPRIEVPELSGDTLLLRMFITESRSCLENNPDRHASLEIVRLFANSAKTEVVSRREFLGINPICDLQSNQSLTIEGAGITFSCVYVGTEGATTNAKPLIYAY